MDDVSADEQVFVTVTSVVICVLIGCQPQEGGTSVM